MKPRRIVILVLLMVFHLAVWAAKGRHSVNYTGQKDSSSVDTTQKKTDSLAVSSTKLPGIQTDSTLIKTAKAITDSIIKKYKSKPINKDSIFSLADSLKILRHVTDSLTTAKNNSGYHIKTSKDAIDAEVTYKARDSIVYDIAHKMVYLYGDAKAHYTTIDMDAASINMDWNTTTLSGETKKDSVGEPIGDVIFKESGETFFAKQMSYNFKSKKGRVVQARTKQEEGFLHLQVGKRDEFEDWYGKRGWFTTCDLEHPHFYIEASKMKLIPHKLIVTGPAHLVVHDIPTPLYVPFGLFPLKKGRRSGIILPQYGEEQVRGFYFRNGGYYFGISDNFDLALTSDIYTKGSWALKADSKYVVRYKFNGNVSVQFGRDLIGEPGTPGFNVLNDFKIQWTHNQDPKAQPDTRFTANVNIATSTYDKNFSYSQAAVTNSALASKISFARTWGNKPYSLSINFNHDQNINTHAVDLTLPQLTFAVTTIHPFKRKISSVTPKWYENLGFNYTFETQNVITGVDSTFFKPATFKNAKYGARQTIPISTSIKLFKYFTLSPAVNYTERWYFQTVREKFINRSDSSYTQYDTISGFKAARDFNASLSLNTYVYGMFLFKHSKLKAIRHVISPSISFNYHPDFAAPFWGYYYKVQTATPGVSNYYSIFQPVSGIYGDVPSPGTQAGLNFAISNILEMKVFSRKDTSSKHERKIKLLENLTISTFYNFAADSLRLSPISIRGYTTLFDKFRVNFSTVLDPYEYDSANQRINKFVWQDERRLVKMRSAEFDVSTSFQSKKSGALNNIANSHGTPEEKAMVMKAPSLYYDFTIPWSINFAYNLNIARGIPGKPDTTIISTSSIRLNLDVTLTEKWKVAVESGYDFVLHDLVYTRVTVIRNLHCWELSFHWVPYPLNRQSYDMQLNVKSSVLQDLKISKKKSEFDSAF